MSPPPRPRDGDSPAGRLSARPRWRLPWLLLAVALTAVHCGAPEGPASPTPVAAVTVPAESPRPSPPVSSPAAPPPFAAVRDRLLPALYPAGSPTVAGLVAREDLPGVLTTLALPSTGGVRGLVSGAPAAWGRPPEEVFRLARRNLEALPALPFREMTLGYGVKIRAALGEDPFVASRALVLERQPGCVGPYGALVGVPTRHHLLCYPIHNSQVSVAVQLMPLALRRLHAAGPGPVSANLYLYRKGRFVDIPYQVGPRGFSMAPPREFLDVLKEVPRSEALRRSGLESPPSR